MGLTRRRVDLLVVGGGPAGMAAAIEAARRGLSVLLADEQTAPGGQLRKQIHKFFGSRRHYAGIRGFRIAESLEAECDAANVEMLFPATVFSLDGRTAGLVHRGRTLIVEAADIVIATGAREKPVCFPGWTKPGIMTVGALQTLMNVHRVLPGRKCVVIGSGNAGLVAAHQLLLAGASVEAVVEAGAAIGGYAVHANKILREGVPIHLGCTIAEATGGGPLEKVRISRSGGGDFFVETECVAIAAGFRPNDDLRRFARGEADEPRIGVVGDADRVEEASIALEQGRLAGMRSALRSGRLDQAEFDREQEAAERALAALRLPRGDHPAAQAGRIAAPAAAGKRIPVIRCRERIACDPCVGKCPAGAIVKTDGPGSPPRLEAERCTGCGLCAASCPGQAITLVGASAADKSAAVTVPFERCPLPELGQTWTGVSETGAPVCGVLVERIEERAAYDGTALVTVRAPRERAAEIAGIRRMA